MKANHKKNPQYFKRRILEYVEDDKALMEREYYWLSMIKPEELGSKYYNKTNYKHGHWIFDEDKKTIVRNKLVKSHWSKSDKREEIIEKIKVGNSYERGPRGYGLKEETKKKLSIALKGKPITYERSEETREKISNNTKRLQREQKIGMHGKTHSDSTKQKMSQNNAMNKEEHRLKIGAANRGKKMLRKDGTKRMAKPDSDLWNELISKGWS